MLTLMGGCKVLEYKATQKSAKVVQARLYVAAVLGATAELNSLVRVSESSLVANVEEPDLAAVCCWDSVAGTSRPVSEKGNLLRYF